MKMHARAQKPVDAFFCALKLYPDVVCAQEARRTMSANAILQRPGPGITPAQGNRSTQGWACGPVEASCAERAATAPHEQFEWRKSGLGLDNMPQALREACYVRSSCNVNAQGAGQAWDAWPTSFPSVEAQAGLGSAHDDMALLAYALL